MGTWETGCPLGAGKIVHGPFWESLLTGKNDSKIELTLFTLKGLLGLYTLLGDPVPPPWGDFKGVSGNYEQGKFYYTTIYILYSVCLRKHTFLCRRTYWFL